MAPTPMFASGRPLSDIDMHAAFCIGRLDGPPLKPSAYPANFQEHIAHLNEEVALALDRLRSYLRPKTYLDNEAIVMAVAEGKAARERTGEVCVSSPQSMECKHLAETVAECRKPDFLPY